MSKVLVVDDDADSRGAIVAYLTKGGHSVRGAGSGLDAIDQVRLDIPDAILPGMDASPCWTCCAPTFRWATIPIAMLTAYPEDPRPWHIGQKGVDCVFHKSKVRMAELLAWVDERACREPPGAEPVEKRSE